RVARRAGNVGGARDQEVRVRGDRDAGADPAVRVAAGVRAPRLELPGRVEHDRRAARVVELDELVAGAAGPARLDLADDDVAPVADADVAGAIGGRAVDAGDAGFPDRAGAAARPAAVDVGLAVVEQAVGAARLA